MSSFARVTAIVFATAAVAAVCFLRRADVGLLSLSLMVTATAAVPIELLVRRGVPRALSIALAYSAAVLLAAALAAGLGPLLVEEISTTADRAFSAYASLRESLTRSPSEAQRWLAEVLPLEHTRAPSPDQGTWALEILGVTTDAMSLISRVLIVLVLGVYFSTNDRASERIGSRFLLQRGWLFARELWTAVLTSVGLTLAFELSKLIVYLLAFTVGYGLLGIEPFVLTATLVTLLLLFPFPGSLLGVCLATIAGAFTDPLHAALAALYTAAVLLAVEISAHRRLRAPRTHPILIVLTLLFLVANFGVLGALLTLPLAAAIEVIGSVLIRSRNARETSSTPFAELRARAERLRAGASATHAGQRELFDDVAHLIDEAIQALRP